MLKITPLLYRYEDPTLHLHPLDIPNNKWESISMDFIISSNGPGLISVQFGFLALKPNHLFIIKIELNYLKIMKPFKPNRLQKI